MQMVTQDLNQKLNEELKKSEKIGIEVITNAGCANIIRQVKMSFGKVKLVLYEDKVQNVFSNIKEGSIHSEVSKKKRLLPFIKNLFFSNLKVHHERTSSNGFTKIRYIVYRNKTYKVEEISCL